MKRMVKNGNLLDVEPDGTITVAGKTVGGGSSSSVITILSSELTINPSSPSVANISADKTEILDSLFQKDNAFYMLIFTVVNNIASFKICLDKMTVGSALNEMVFKSEDYNVTLTKKENGDYYFTDYQNNDFQATFIDGGIEKFEIIKVA